MALTDNIPSFPLFSHMFPSDYMCLYKFDPSEEKFVCGEYIIDSFASLVEHLKKVHGCRLVPKIDLCLECETIFQSKLDSVEHWLSHALSVENSNCDIV